MRYNLSIINGEYCLEVIDSIDDRKRITRIHDQNEIFDIVSGFMQYANMVVEYKGKMKFIFDDKIITLNEFEKYKDKQLYSYIYDSIDTETKIIKNVEHINKKKLLAIALTGVTILTLTVNGIIALGNDEKINKTETTYVTPTLTIAPTTIPTNAPTVTIAPTITPTPTVTPTPIPENINRLMETTKLCNNEMSNSDVIPLATKLTDYSLEQITNFFQTDGWHYIEKDSSNFGVDPYLLLSIGYPESNLLHERTLPGGSSYNGFAVGRFQHETPDKEWNITAYNYNTNEWEIVRMCMENAVDEEMNTKMAAMILQNRLYEFNNNIYLTIQSYNYGVKAMNIIISKYAEEINCTIEDVKNNYTDIGWMKYVEDFHYNPQNYIKWDYKTYGDKDYVKKVLGYYIGTETINYDKDGNIVTVNLINVENNYGSISR